MDKQNIIGHLAAGGAYAIFGFNIVGCKDIANSGVISPLALFSLRAIGATLLFWLASLFMPKEKVSGKDLLMIIAAALIGLVIPQMTFLFAITMSSSIDTAILSVFTPIWTMLIAAVVLGEPITLKKASGVAISLAGVLVLIFNSLHYASSTTATTPLGVVLLLANGLSFAAYLGIFRPLISRYTVVTFMKWMFLFTMLMTLPFSLKDMIGTDYAAITPKVGLEIAFLIVFATLIAYYLIPIGQKKLRPTLVSMYSYLQPIIACLISIISGLDVVTWQKVLAITAVFSGVAIVNRSRSAGEPKLK